MTGEGEEGLPGLPFRAVLESRLATDLDMGDGHGAAAHCYRKRNARTTQRKISSSIR